LQTSETFKITILKTRMWFYFVHTFFIVYATYNFFVIQRVIASHEKNYFALRV